MMLNLDKYHVIDVEGDGNCFFRAIACALDQVGLESTTHLSLRKKAVKYLLNHADLLNNHPPEHETSNAYLLRMSCDKEWAEGSVIEAMALALNVCFSVTEARDGHVSHEFKLNEA